MDSTRRDLPDKVGKRDAWGDILDIKLREAWPVLLFAAVTSICLILWATIDSGAATLVAGLLSSGTTAFVGWVAYRGLVVPVRLQQTSERVAIATGLLADLTEIDHAFFEQQAALESYMREVEEKCDFWAHEVTVAVSDRRLHALESRIGFLPLATVVYVYQAYAKAMQFPAARVNAEIRAAKSQTERMRQCWSANERFNEVAAAMRAAISSLAAIVAGHTK